MVAVAAVVKSDKSETHTHTPTHAGDGGSRTTQLLAQVKDEHAAVRGRGADLIPSGVPADFKDPPRAFVTVHQLAGLKQVGREGLKSAAIQGLSAMLT